MEFSFSYPKHLKVDFKKLERGSLIRILRHYGLNPRNEVDNDELAIIAARCFDKSHVPGAEFIDAFANKHCQSTADTSQSQIRKKPKYSDKKSDSARTGEQVAAKLNKTLDDGNWVLANVLNYDPKTKLYDVQDEDDTASPVITPLPACEVKKLEDSGAHLKKGDLILAVFPETTSFYKAIVAKTVKPPTGNGAWEIVVRFDDDVEDGKIPPRRVPARFVIKRSDLGDNLLSSSS